MMRTIEQWANEQAHMNKKKYLKNIPRHVMEYS
jgi:hypothetical protein